MSPQADWEQTGASACFACWVSGTNDITKANAKTHAGSCGTDDRIGVDRAG
jgi:hypothetical protein